VCCDSTGRHELVDGSKVDAPMGTPVLALQGIQDVESVHLTDRQSDLHHHREDHRPSLRLPEEVVGGSIADLAAEVARVVGLVAVG
jgi:hypothetical protein